MAERRRIRLAAVPYEEEVDGGDARDDVHANPRNFRRLAYKDEGAYEEQPSIQKKKPKQKSVKVTPGKNKSKRLRRQPRKKSRKSNKRAAAETSNLMEELETTTWSLLKTGKKFIEKSIEEGKVQALKAAIRLRQKNDRNYRPRSGRVNTKRRTNKRSRKRSEFGLGAVHPSSSDESHSIKSGSSYSSKSTFSNGASSYSDGEPSMSLSASSSKSSKKRNGSKSSSSKSKLNVDASFDSLGENSIIADDSYTTEESLPSEESSTGHTSSEDEGSIVSGAWTAIKNIVQNSEADANSRHKEQNKPSGAMKMEILPEPEFESSDSWIESIKTDSNESFSTALNKELSYHRQMPSKTTMETTRHRINEINDVSSTKGQGHQRKSTAELSDAEFLKVIRETVNQEIDAKQTPTTDANTGFLELIDKPTESDQAPTSSSTLSNTGSLKAMQEENGIEEGANSSHSEPSVVQQENGVEDEVDTTPASPTLSNVDFLKAVQQENGVEEDVDTTPATAPLLSNADFLKAMQEENGVKDEVDTTPASPTLSNADFLKAMQEENGVEGEAEASPATVPLLSNADFLKAMQEENGVEDEAEATPAPAAILSNADFLKAIQQENEFAVETSSETRDQQLTLSDDLSNADFLTAMKQSLSATGGKFEQEPETELPIEVYSELELEDDKITELGFSNSDFLKAMQQTEGTDDNTFSGNKASTDTPMNANLLSALRQMGGTDHGNTSMFSNGKLETILEVDSVYSKSAQSNPATSPPTSYTLTEEAVEVVMNTDGSHSDNKSPGDVQSDVPLVFKQQDCSAAPQVEQMEQTTAAEALVTKPKDVVGSGNELPDLKCVSSDESDTHFDPLQGTESDDSEKEDIDDGDTGFMTADDILAEDDTNFFSVGGDADSQLFSAETENHHQGVEKDAIGSSDSLDEILSDRKGAEEPATIKSQGTPPTGTGDGGIDEASAEIETRSENPGLLENRMEQSEKRVQDMSNEEAARCTAAETDTQQAITDHDDSCVTEAEVECRQDESSAPLAEESSQDDIEERKAIIRAIQVDESLTPEEKELLINEIESGVPIDEMPSGEVDVPETPNGPQTADRDAPEQASRMEINKAIGKKVMQGWTLLDSTCPQCVLPLMADNEATEAVCIFCDYRRSMSGDHGTKVFTLAAPPPPPPIANKKAKKRRTRTTTNEVPVDAPSSLVVSE